MMTSAERLKWWLPLLGPLPLLPPRKMKRWPMLSGLLPLLLPPLSALALQRALQPWALQPDPGQAAHSFKCFGCDRLGDGCNEQISD